MCKLCTTKIEKELHEKLRDTDGNIKIIPQYKIYTDLVLSDWCEERRYDYCDFLDCEHNGAGDCLVPDSIVKYVLDFYIIHPKFGKFDIECDGEKYHSTKVYIKKDNMRNRSMVAQGIGVIRLGGRFILEMCGKDMIKMLVSMMEEMSLCGDGIIQIGTAHETTWLPNYERSTKYNEQPIATSYRCGVCGAVTPMDVADKTNLCTYNTRKILGGWNR